MIPNSSPVRQVSQRARLSPLDRGVDLASRQRFAPAPSSGSPSTPLRTDPYQLNTSVAPGKVNVLRDAVAATHERRRRRRAAVRPMYSAATIRVLASRTGPIEAYVIDLSENGIAVEADDLVPVGEAITEEFRIPGIGRLQNEQWPEFVAAGEIVRHDNVDDFPGGPYRMAIRFAQLPTMTQAQIARYIATQLG